MGQFTNKARKIYQNICHLSERGVLNYMRDFLGTKYGPENMIISPAYLMVKGDIPVALVAHADTVFKRPPAIENFFYDQEKDVIWNPDGAGADDRAGVFAITHIIKHTALRPHVIITTGEETGCVGSSKLIAQQPKFPWDLKFMVQLDRRGHKDSVYYDCDNFDFETFINQFGFETHFGSFTDISLLAPTWGVAAVNFSIGYEDEHMEIERLHVDWMYETINKTINLLDHVRKNLDTVPVYEYVDKYPYHYGGWQNGNYWFDDDDDWDIAPGFKHCYMCNKPEKVEDMIPFYYPYHTQQHNMCMECYSDCVDQVVWCEKCNKGYFLTPEQVKEIPDVNHWICEDCKNGQNSGTVQPSNIIQPGFPHSKSQYRRIVCQLGTQQSPIHQDDGFSDLAAGYASDL